MDLNEALGEFDAVETTLKRLETVAARLSELTPEDMSYSPQNSEEYEDIRRAFRNLVDGLPALDGWKITEFPWGLDEVLQNRFDARDVGELHAHLSVEEGIRAHGEQVREYRFRFNGARRVLVRRRAEELIGDIRTLLPELKQRVARDSEPITDPDWPILVERIQELDRLMGNSITRTGRWNDLRRHMAFAQGVDLHDIEEHDWPTVVKDIEAGLYGEFEPMPVKVEDLGALAQSQPGGAVRTKLAWEALSDEDFERLIFNIISDAPGYENPQWLTKTRAPDRGRDISVDRVLSDSLSGVQRLRVIIQCRHQLSKSVTPSDVGNALTSMKLLEPPPVDVLIFATSSRFTGDAAQLIDKHNHDRERPKIDPWPESHLESLLAQRADLVTEFRLRPDD
jgi:hypothetical protein